MTSRSTEQVLPVVAIVGRPNVGKSTLFNRMTGQNQAIVEDRPGVTIDRNYGIAPIGDREVWLVDTGGFEPKPQSSLFAKMKAQAELALEEADVVIFLMDAKDGPMPDDHTVAKILRRSKKPVIYAVNKAESEKLRDMSLPDFYALGLDEILAVSAAHNHGIVTLEEEVEALLPPVAADEAADTSEESEEDHVCRVAVIGRPNAGKSTLVNQLLGEDRMVVDDTPGTTRDSVDVPINFDGTPFVIVDTAGIRRKSKVNDFLERMAVMRALRSVDKSHVVILMLDAQEGPADQEAKIASYALSRGKAIVIAVNKWDIIPGSIDSESKALKNIEHQFPFLSFAPVVFISAKTGRRVKKLMVAAHRVYRQGGRKLGANPLNKWLSSLTLKHQPPMIHNKRTKFYYISQIASRPPAFAIQTNTKFQIPPSYERFLINNLRKEYGFEGTPLRIYFRHKKHGDKSED